MNDEPASLAVAVSEADQRAAEASHSQEEVGFDEPRGGDLVLQVPKTWLRKESHTLLAPDGRANVILSSEPLDPEISSETYAAVQGQLLAEEFPGFIEFAFESFEAFGLPQGFIRIFEWQPPDGDPVRQVQMYATIPGRGFTATATTPNSEFGRFEEILVEALERIAIQNIG